MQSQFFNVNILCMNIDNSFQVLKNALYSALKTMLPYVAMMVQPIKINATYLGPSVWENIV